MIAAAVTPLSAEIILLQFALATTLDGICALIALKFCRAQCKSRRFATETSLSLGGWTDVRPVTPHDVLEIEFWRIPVEFHFIFMMIDCVERYAGERSNHGEEWFPKLMAVCQLIDREIDPGTVEGALLS